jgi:rhodanese-related sulfurtransferase
MKTINAIQLDEMKQQGNEFLLVNTLDEEQFGKTKIEDAVNIPLSSDDFVKKVEQHASSKDDTVVVYCASADCPSSTKAGEKLEEAGFTHVLDFEDGAKGWQESGHRLAAV